MTQHELATERKVHDLQVTASDLLKLRCDRATAHLLDAHEGELMAALGTLTVLCDELRADRIESSRVLEAAE